MLNWACIWLLCLLPLPILLWLLLPRAKVDTHAGLRVPFYQRLSELSNQKRYRFPLQKILLLSLLWILLVLAAAGPQWLGKATFIPRSGRDILLAIDLSGSMSTQDLYLKGKPATRLTVIKSIASDFINRREGDKLGLLLFGSKPYLQTPLTFDRKTVTYMLKDATIGLAGQQTSIGDAIGLATKILRRAPKNNRVLILLTDGSNTAGVLTPLQAAKLAKAADVKIYTIGIGANRMVVDTLFGPKVINPSSDLDQKTLQKIAKMTGGLYFRAKNTESLEKVYKKLDALEPTKSKGEWIRPIKPLYPWPLGIALLISTLVILSRLYLRRVA